jgi:hypothetical protein
VRGCVSSTPSIRISRSFESLEFEEGSGADVGVKDMYAWLRLGSADPKAEGDSISVVERWGFSSSSGCGFVRRLLPDDDSELCSGWIWC